MRLAAGGEAVRVGVVEASGRGASAGAGGRGSALFAGSAFASAFLIFVVQPMVAKRIVPWFGGVPSVWIVCLAFYQTALFVGYAYAHCLIRFVRPARQPFVHALAFAAALFALPVLPGDSWKPAGAVAPGLAILAMLGAHVAPPFVALAATGPLVQAWFARRYPGRSPYPLYAVSNLGSFLALVAYPFVLEPRLSLSRTGGLWSLAFVATAPAVLACAALARREAASDRAPALSAAERPGPLRVALWLLLPGCAVVLLMGVTNALTLDVASVPFLWMLPLGVYLATFVLCFGSARVYRRVPWLLVAVAPLLAQRLIPIAVPADAEAIRAIAGSLQAQIAGHVVLLFGACMVLHGELYRLRPPARALTAFYLCLSGGGALGGIFTGALAPRLFDDYRELGLGLALGWLLLLAASWYDAEGWLSRSSPRWRWVVVLLLTAIALPYEIVTQLGEVAGVVHRERTFFGVLRVWRYGMGAAEQHQLWNGTTLHGVQFRGAPRQPTSYYGSQTGIGFALGLRTQGSPVSIGVIGLGVGTLAAYGRPGDRVRFYEVDPAVIRIARDRRYFDYLSNSRAAVEVIEGDARISLASERERGELPAFDFLIVDAFSSDAIPLHLLTRQALALYLEALKPDGLLAFHVSNRSFDLGPVLGRLGEDAGLAVALFDPAGIKRRMSAPANWVFLARSEERLRSLAELAIGRRDQLGLPPEALQVGRPLPAAVAATRLWTDDYSDLLGALRPLRALGARRAPPAAAQSR
jgi:spermidine synthase